MNDAKVLPSVIAKFLCFRVWLGGVGWNTSPPSNPSRQIPALSRLAIMSESIFDSFEKGTLSTREEQHVSCCLPHGNIIFPMASWSFPITVAGVCSSLTPQRWCPEVVQGITCLPNGSPVTPNGFNRSDNGGGACVICAHGLKMLFSHWF